MVSISAHTQRHVYGIQFCCIFELQTAKSAQRPHQISVSWTNRMNTHGILHRVSSTVSKSHCARTIILSLLTFWLFPNRHCTKPKPDLIRTPMWLKLYMKNWSEMIHKLRRKVFITRTTWQHFQLQKNCEMSQYCYFIRTNSTMSSNLYI